MRPRARYEAEVASVTSAGSARVVTLLKEAQMEAILVEHDLGGLARINLRGGARNASPPTDEARMTGTTIETTSAAAGATVAATAEAGVVDVAVVVAEAEVGAVTTAVTTAGVVAKVGAEVEAGVVAGTPAETTAISEGTIATIATIVRAEFCNGGQKRRPWAGVIMSKRASPGLCKHLHGLAVPAGGRFLSAPPSRAYATPFPRLATWFPRAVPRERSSSCLSATLRQTSEMISSPRLLVPGQNLARF
jgi:hypothetical protein